MHFFYFFFLRFFKLSQNLHVQETYGQACFYQYFISLGVFKCFSVFEDEINEKSKYFVIILIVNKK